MKRPCAVVRDLLPLYAEGMLEPETEELVRAHMEDCGECRERLSGMRAEAAAPAEAAGPLKALRKELLRRRWFTAAAAGLMVFVALFAYFHHANEARLIPWEDGLIRVLGVEARAWGEIFGGEALPGDGDEAEDALVLRVPGRLGYEETAFTDDDGARTVILQAWGRGSWDRIASGDEHELLLHPVPDRLIYDGGGRQELLWGEPMDGGAEILPRLALTYYLLIAAIAAALTGVLWLILRERRSGGILRQLFFAPLAWIAAHLLIKGTRAETFFMGRDVAAILLTAAALYALFTLLWQLLPRRSKAV